MFNVFTLGTVFTSIDLVLNTLSLLACAFEARLRTLKIIIPLIIVIVCLILELNGLIKKHYGLTIFSVIFRGINFLSWFGIAILIGMAIAGIVPIPQFRHGGLHPQEQNTLLCQLL